MICTDHFFCGSVHRPRTFWHGYIRRTLTAAFHPMSSLAYALSMQQAGENRGNLYVHVRDSRALLNETQLSLILHKLHQVYFTQQYLCKALYDELAKKHLAVLFDSNTRAVREYLPGGAQDAQSPSPDRMLDETSKLKMIIMIIQISDFIRGSQQTAIPFTIRSCLQRTGLSPNTHTRRCKLKVNREALHQNDGITGLWGRNSSGAELSRHRRVRRFAILHIEFCCA
jgi:hypothetical protein